MQRPLVGSREQSAFDPPMLVTELNFQMKDLFAQALEPKNRKLPGSITPA
jgi:hypothetical protein